MKTPPKALLFGTCLAIAGTLLSPSHVIAQYNLSSLGSTMSVDLTGGTGINNWQVDTSPDNQLDKEWFYYSVNGGPVQAINALGLSGAPTVTANTLNATYGTGLSVDVGFTLQGAGSLSGKASLTANLLTVTSTSALTSLNVYEYANFNLLQSSDNQISITADYAPPQLGGGLLGYNGVNQYSGSTALTEGIGSPDANYAEAGTASSVMTDILSGNNLNGPLSFGPMPNTDVAYAFEWTYSDVAANNQVSVLSGQTLSIALIPEPSTFALIGLGLGALGLLRRRSS